jgi:hypothetical protein
MFLSDMGGREELLLYNFHCPSPLIKLYNKMILCLGQLLGLGNHT